MNPFDITKLNAQLQITRMKVKITQGTQNEGMTAEQLKNDFEWKDFDKVYVSIVIDDCYKDISEFLEMFINENVPLCLALPPSQLDVICENGETVKQVAQRCITNGGEILAHGFGPLTSNSSDDEYYEKLINAKKILFENGFTNINGIITTGGADYLTADFEKCVHLIRPYYLYSDLYGYNTNAIQYYHKRNALGYNVPGNRTSVYEALQQFKMNQIGSWVVVYCHGTIDLVQNGSLNKKDDITQAVANLQDLIEWIKTQENCEIVTYKTVYDKFKSSKLEQLFESLK